MQKTLHFTLNDVKYNRIVATLNDIQTQLRLSMPRMTMYPMQGRAHQPASSTSEVAKLLLPIAQHMVTLHAMTHPM